MTATGWSDKKEWVGKGVVDELRFLDDVAPTLPGRYEMNPERETNKYAIDLLVNGCPTDLKHVQTPLFRAKALVGRDPFWTVPLTHRAYIHYANGGLYSRSNRPWYILFWVDWRRETDYGVEVPEHRGVYAISVEAVDLMVTDALKTNRPGTMHYKERGGSNSKLSWELDLRSMKKLVGWPSE